MQRQPSGIRNAEHTQQWVVREDAAVVAAVARPKTARPLYEPNYDCAW